MDKSETLSLGTIEIIEHIGTEHDALIVSPNDLEVLALMLQPEPDAEAVAEAVA